MRKFSHLLLMVFTLTRCQEPVGSYQERIGLWVIMQEKEYNASMLKNVFTERDLQKAELWAQQNGGEVKICYVFRQSGWWRIDQKYILAVNIAYPTWLDVLWASRGWQKIPEHLTIHSVSSKAVKEWFDRNDGSAAYIPGYRYEQDSPDATKM